MLKAKRILAAMIVAVIIICMFFSAISSYAVMDMSLGINDSLVEPPGGVRPIFVDNVCYVPIETFTKYFSLTYSYDGVSKALSVIGGSHSLSFNIRQNIATSDSLEVYYVTCYYENSTFMVPARVMCEVFGLRYSFISSINTVRIRLNAANLSDGEFAEKYMEEIVPKPPEPDVPSNGNDDDDGTEKIHTPDVYLMFSTQSMENLDDTLDTLDDLGISATFFISDQLLSDAPDAAAKIVARGHGLGMDLSELDLTSNYTAQSALSYVNGLSFDIARLYKVNTNAIYMKEEQYESLGRNIKAALADEGYHIWTPELTASDSVYSVTSRLTGAKRAMSVILENGDGVSNMIRGIANYVFENDASFNTIKLTSKP